jgi:hypothetical protein
MVRNLETPLKIAHFLGISQNLIKIPAENVSGRFSREAKGFEHPVLWCFSRLYSNSGEL